MALSRDRTQKMPHRVFPMGLAVSSVLSLRAGGEAFFVRDLDAAAGDFHHALGLEVAQHARDDLADRTADLYGFL